MSGRLGLRMMAVVASTPRGRVYRLPTEDEIHAAVAVTRPDDLPSISLGDANQYVAPPRYGLFSHLDLYTPRQLVVLTAFADAVAACHGEIIHDGGSREWADAVTTLLGLEADG